MKELTPRIEVLEEKLLVGHFMQMTLSANRTFELWSGFQKKRSEISDVLSSDLYSMQVYDSNLDFKNFSPSTVFTKWAAIEVCSLAHLPEGLHSYTLKGGLYAVFHYVGRPQGFGVFMQQIMTVWLPKSEYQIDQREHFELLGDKYKRDSAESEEEVWIPIKLK